MEEVRKFYSRYWQDKHIKINSFDHPPLGWTEENFVYHYDFFKPFIKGKILDYGCGQGQFLDILSSHSDYCFGVDICKEVIIKARMLYPKIEFKVLLEKGEIPYSDSYFDTVFAIDVFEHILDIESALEEISRVLKPEGHILIATSELTAIKTIIIAFTALDKYFYPTSPHIRYFTKNNLSDLLKKKNFEVISYKRNRTYFGFIPRGQMVVAKNLK